jgi:hypothetical protein
MIIVTKEEIILLNITKFYCMYEDGGIESVFMDDGESYYYHTRSNSWEAYCTNTGLPELLDTFSDVKYFFIIQTEE